MDAAACPSDELLARFVGRALDEAERARVEQHVAACSSCEDAITLLVTAFASGDPDGDGAPLRLPEPGQTLGRYQILEWVGAGAMGTVCTAHDPELARRVALKILVPRPGDAGAVERARFVAEAKAVARVQSPNVIEIYDVGIEGDIAYFAMEFIEGTTLRSWLGSRRTPAEVVDVFVACGRGLVDAHREGLIHRDFKPENVLVGNDGRVQVIDFGLARHLERISEGVTRDDAPASVANTRAGEVVGTPAYMAPEQLRAEAVDARADQFAFCVALYEALCGTRPFRGDSPRALLDAIEGRDPRTEATRMAPRVRRVVERGLSVEASDRFASMEALVAALEATRARRLRGPALAGGAAALVLAAYGVGAFRATPPCGDGTERMAGVWDASVQRRLEAQWPDRGPASRFIVAELDRYAATWASTHDAICRAAEVAQTIDRETGARRMDCLDQLHRRLQSTVSFMADAPAVALAHAPALVGGLESPEDCDRDVASPATVTAEEVRRVLAQVEPILDRVDVLQRAGDREEALAALEQVLPTVERLPLEVVRADALTSYGSLLVDLGRHREGIEVLGQAVQAALGSGDAGAVVEPAAHLACAHADFGSVDAGRVYASMAEDAVEAGDASRVAAGRTEYCVAWLAHKRGRNEEAEARFRAALARVSDAEGADHPSSAYLRSARGLMLQHLGRVEEADAEHARATADFEANLGRLHPTTIGARSRWVESLASRQAFDEAERQARLAVEAWDELDQPPTKAEGNAHMQLARVLGNTERYDEARREVMRAVDVFAAALGPDDAVTLDARGVLAGSWAAQGRLAEALAAYETLLPRLRQVHTPRAPSLLQAENNVAQILAGLGRDDESRARAAAVVQACEERPPPPPAICRRAEQLAQTAASPHD